MLQPDTLLRETYRVQRVLGQGGMSLVLAVKHVQMGELFASRTTLLQTMADLFTARNS